MCLLILTKLVIDVGSCFTAYVVFLCFLFRRETSHFENGEHPPFYNHGRIIGEVLFLLKK